MLLFEFAKFLYLLRTPGREQDAIDRFVCLCDALMGIAVIRGIFPMDLTYIDVSVPSNLRSDPIKALEYTNSVRHQAAREIAQKKALLVAEEFRLSPIAQSQSVTLGADDLAGIMRMSWLLLANYKIDFKNLPSIIKDTAYKQAFLKNTEYSKIDYPSQHEIKLATYIRSNWDQLSLVSIVELKKLYLMTVEDKKRLENILSGLYEKLGGNLAYWLSSVLAYLDIAIGPGFKVRQSVMLGPDATIAQPPAKLVNPAIMILNRLLIKHLGSYLLQLEFDILPPNQFKQDLVYKLIYDCLKDFDSRLVRYELSTPLDCINALNEVLKQNIKLALRQISDRNRLQTALEGLQNDLEVQIQELQQGRAEWYQPVKTPVAGKDARWWQKRQAMIIDPSSIKNH